MAANRDAEISRALAAGEMAVAELFEGGLTDHAIIASAFLQLAEKHMGLALGADGARRWPIACAELSAR